MENNHNSREEWFKERIQKRVFRTKNGCSCKTCERIYNEGLIIHDEDHLDYILLCEAEGHDPEYIRQMGIPLKYFDTQEEVKQFELEWNAK